MDPSALQAFVAVAAGSSFSSAAAQLHLTQPAVSKRIAALEQELGTRLFDRIGRRVTLTEAGAELLPRANRILREMSEAARALRELDGSVSGRLAIGTSHHVGLHRLPAVLRDFSRRYPTVSLAIAFMDSEQAHEAVQRGALELAVITLAPQEPAPRLRARRIWDDPLAVVVARDHPLARARGRVDIATLAAHPAVLPGAETYTGQILQSLFAAAHAPLAVSMSTNYLETLRMLATIGLGWSVLPQTMLTPELVPLELPGVRLRRWLGYVCHRDHTLSTAARAFIAALEAEATAQGPQPGDPSQGAQAPSKARQ